MMSKVSKVSKRAIKTALALGLSWGPLGAAAAEAQEVAPAYWPAAQVQARPDRADHWQLSVGVRTTLLRDASFDRFSTDDAMAQLSSAVSHVLGSSGRLSLAAGLGVDLGSSAASARAATASLRLDRASLLVEGRYRAHARAQAFLRLAPGVIHGSATVVDVNDSAIGSLDQSFVLPSVDGSAGVAFALVPASTVLGVWVVGEGGYGWARDQHLVLSQHLDARDQNKAGTLDFGTLSPRGAFFRLALAVSF